MYGASTSKIYRLFIIAEFVFQSTILVGMAGHACRILAQRKTNYWCDRCIINNFKPQNLANGLYKEVVFIDR